MSEVRMKIPEGRWTSDDVDEQQTLWAIKNIFDNRRALTNEEKAILIKLGRTLKERVQGNDDEEEEG